MGDSRSNSCLGIAWSIGCNAGIMDDAQKTINGRICTMVPYGSVASSVMQFSDCRVVLVVDSVLFKGLVHRRLAGNHSVGNHDFGFRYVL